MRPLTYLPLIAALAVLSGCGGPAAKPTAHEETPTVKAGVHVVAEADAPTTLEALGTIRPKYSAMLSAKVMGRVADVYVREGDAVRAGQVLVRLDARDLAANVDVASASMRAARVGAQTARTAANMENETSAARVRQAEAALTQARAALEGARAGQRLVVAGPRTQEREQANLAVAQAAAQLRLAASDLERAKALFDQGAIARRVLEAAQTAYDTAKAAHDTAVQSQKMAQEGSRREEVEGAAESVRQAEAAVAQAEAGVAQARAATQQVKVRQDEIRAADAQAAQASAATRAAQVARSFASLAAPFDGVVATRMVDPGAMAAPGSPLLTVHGGPLRLEVQVPESALKAAKIGSQIEVRIDAIESTFRATVVESSPAGDPATHTFLVRAELPPDTGALAGMFGRARIETGRRKRLMIPAVATWTKAGLAYVWALSAEGAAQLRLVTLGEKSGQRVEVLSGLSPGDKIVVEGREGVRDGAKVQAR